MHVASRPYLAAGVALVGATAIAVSPIAPPAPDIQLPTFHASSAPVALSAVTNPIELWGEVIETSLGNLNARGQQWLANPTPILRQILANQLYSATNLPNIVHALAARLGDMNPADPTSVPAMLQQFITNQVNGVGILTDTLKTLLDQLVAVMNPADPFGVPATIQKMLTEIADGEFEMGFTTFASLGVAIGFPVIMASFPIAGVISQPFKDLANIIDPTGVASAPLRNLARFIDTVPAVLPSVLLNGVLGPLNAVGAVSAATLEDLMGAVLGADPVAFVSTLVNAPARLTDAFLNGHLAAGDFPMAGLIGGPFDTSSIGAVLSALRDLARAIATPEATLPSPSASTLESASVTASPLSSGAKTTITLDVAADGDANVAAEPASSGAVNSSTPVNEPVTTEPSVTEPPVPEAESDEPDEAGQVKDSLKAEPGKTGMGATDPDSAEPADGAGDDVTDGGEDVTEGPAGSAGDTESATAGAPDAGAGASDASASGNAGSTGSSDSAAA